MPFSIDRLGRHSDARPATTRVDIAKIAEIHLRDAAFLIARSRFLAEINNSTSTGLDRERVRSGFPGQ